LNRAGTQLAIVWTQGGSSQMRNETLEAVLKGHKLTADELTGSSRAKALKQFRSGTGWHRADGLDQLSEEEAGIIAARLLRRVQARTPLSKAKAATLRISLTNALKERFVGSPARASRTAEEERYDFLKKAAAYLNETELASLREAFASGLRPLTGEK
jgi:hypothetical protein